MAIRTPLAKYSFMVWRAALLFLVLVQFEPSAAERSSVDVDSAIDQESAESSVAWRDPQHRQSEDVGHADRVFGQCRAQRHERGRGDLDKVTDSLAEQRARAEERPARARCEGGTLIGSFLADGKYKEECCRLSGKACSGCGAVANGTCGSCAAGFSLHHGSCVACDDIAGWKDVAGATCVDYARRGTCKGGMDPKLADDDVFKGLRPSQACCACGGGRVVATPWQYAVSDQVLLYGEKLEAEKPSPTTAPRFEVSKDCQLGQLNATVGGLGVVSGHLPAYTAGASGTEVTCEVSALQDEQHGVTAASELTLTVQAMSYGPKVVIFAFEDDSQVPVGNKSWPLSIAAGLKSNLSKTPAFRASCAPDVPWVQVDPASGTLSYTGTSHEQSADLTSDATGISSAQCMLMAALADGQKAVAAFAVAKVFLWSAMHYPQTVHARQGKTIHTLRLRRTPPGGFESYIDKGSGRIYWYKKEHGHKTLDSRMSVPPALRPDILAVSCQAATKHSLRIRWSLQTGLVTVEGQPALIISPQTGDVSGSNQVELPASLRARSLQLTCRVAAGGEMYAQPMVTTLDVRLMDNTCWHRRWIDGSIWYVPGESGGDCSAQCRAAADCGGFWTASGKGNKTLCYLLTSRYQGSLAKPRAVFVRNECQEGMSCLELKSSHVRVLEGRYCPQGALDENLCRRPLGAAKRSATCHGAGAGEFYLMFSLRATAQRFNKSVTRSSTNIHFTCVKYTEGKWYAHDTAHPKAFEPEPTDVLVAALDLDKRNISSLKGTADRVGGLRKGYARGNLAFAAVAGSSQAYEVSGTAFLAWECGAAAAVVYSRGGATAEDKLYLSRGICPLPGRGGTWVVRRANETDYLNPQTGSVELRGTPLACVDEDLEQDAFETGSAQSTVWLSQTAFVSSKDYVTVAAANNASRLKITASLSEDHCSAPDTLSGFTFGTPDDPELYDLNPCECFGESHRGVSPVTEESRVAVKVDIEKSFNDFQPTPQLLSSGPFACEDSAVLLVGQINEIGEEDCQVRCAGEPGCHYYMYTPQLRFCTLLASCVRLGHTGLAVNNRIFGMFKDSTSYCRVADPAKCWTSFRRRSMLQGGGGASAGCAFQDVLEQCDLMKMTVGDASATCGECAYHPLTSDEAQGRRKSPLPRSFPGGSQLSVGCGSQSVLLSSETKKALARSVITCVAGRWIDQHGSEGLSKLTCSSCVQVAQPEMSQLAQWSAPEAYFLSKRKLQHHFGIPSDGCRRASSYATAAPLRVNAGKLCMMLGHASIQQAMAGRDCSASWFTDYRGRVISAGRARRCLVARKGKPMIEDCQASQTKQNGGFSAWEMDSHHRLRNVGLGKCLALGTNGTLQLASCTAGVVAEASKKAWYFDGGDCRFSMRLLSTEKPMAWQFQLVGGGVLGNQMRMRETLPLQQAKDSIDTMSFGTCRVSMQVGLPGVKMENVQEKFKLHSASGTPVTDLYTKGVAATIDGRTLFTCSPGGAGGAKVVAQAIAEKAQKQANLTALESGCANVEKTSRIQPLASHATKLSKPFRLRAPHNNDVLDALYSRHDNGFTNLLVWYHEGTQDRQWSASFSPIQGATLDPSRSIEKDSGSVRDVPFHKVSELECPDYHVVTGLSSKGYENSDRTYAITCTPVKGLKPGSWSTSNWVVQSALDAELRYTPGSNEFIVGIRSEYHKYNKDRVFSFKTVKLCRDVSTEISVMKAEIKELDASIKRISDKIISCAHDIELPKDKIQSLAMSYQGVAPNVTVDTRCPVLHFGDPESMEAYSLTAEQAMNLARSSAYHATAAGDPKAAPFESKQANPLVAAGVGWFSLVDHGATVWGLQCRTGSVVVMHGDVASPYCLSVNAGASTEDITVDGAMPASATCARGYAVAGWYNLFGSAVKSAELGGPASPSGFRLTCRTVPGLSKLCTEQDNRCERHQVVTGIQYKRGKTVKYMCCKMPMPVGTTFADSVLRRVKSWEGYYCPAKLDATGRPEYALQEGLAPSSSWKLNVEEIWPSVSRTVQTKDTADFADQQLLCGPGEALTQWRVQRSGHSKANGVLLAFTCAKLPMDPDQNGVIGMGPQGCRWQTAQGTVSAGSGPLVLPEVKCGTGEALAGFMITNNTSRLKSYCCSVRAGQARLLRTTKRSEPAQRFIDLDDTDAACARGEVMLSFKLEAGSSFSYSCAGVAIRRPLQNPGGRLRWDKFNGLWTLSSSPSLIEHRDAMSQLTKERIRWRVSCPNGFTVAGFGFHTLGDGMGTISGYCASTASPAEGTAACTSVKGGAQQHSGVQSLTLNKVSCQKGSVIQSFAYERVGAGSLELSASCCRSPSTNATSSTTCSNYKSTAFLASTGYAGLAGSRVQCPEGSLASIKLLQSSGGKLHFVFQCCMTKAQELPQHSIHSEAASASGASQAAKAVRVTVKVESRFWLNGRELRATSMNGFNAVVLAAGLQRAKETRHFAASKVTEVTTFLNSLSEHEVVLLAVKDNGLEHLTEPLLFALQRLGSTLREKGKAGEGYALVGSAGLGAWAEAKPGAVEPYQAEADIAPSFVALPIMDLDMAFMTGSVQNQPSLDAPPEKPKLKVFKAESANDDQFCDLAKRNFQMDQMDAEKGPPAAHPCMHAYLNKDTEQHAWECAERDIDRAYLAAESDANQQRLDAMKAKFKELTEFVGLGVGIAAAAIGAIPPGSWAAPALETAKVTSKLRNEIVKKSSAAVFAKTVGAANSAILKEILHRHSMAHHAGKIFKGAAKIFGLYTQINPSWVPGWRSKVPSAEALDKRELHSDDEAIETMLKDESTGLQFPAFPRMKPPGAYGFSTVENNKKLAKAGFVDCDPLQAGLSKMMCDLYCTENAVKEGNRAVLGSLKDSNRVLMDNIKALLDYHSKTLMWQLSQKEGDGLMNLAWTPGQGDETTALPDEQVQSALAELRQDLPRALGHMLPDNGTAVHPEALGWHRRASAQLLDSLQSLLAQPPAVGGDPTSVVRRATELIQRFSAEQALHVRAPAPPGADTAETDLGRLTSRKVAQLRGRVLSTRQMLQASSDLRPEPLQALEAEAPVSDEVAAHYARLSASLVAAHEHHSIFVQVRERALRASEEAIGAAEEYVGCKGPELQGLHDRWHRAYRLDDEASHSLLRAWASTVAAQEHLRSAMRGGLAVRLAQAAVPPVGADTSELIGQCDDLQMVAERSHELGVHELDKALWPVVEQIMSLEALADYEESELKAAHLKGVKRVPADEVVSALQSVADHGADPQATVGRHLAARSLNVLGPAACPAPSFCGGAGMLLINTSSHSSSPASNGTSSEPVYWTSSSPGDLLLHKPAAKVVRACQVSRPVSALQVDKGDSDRHSHSASSNEMEDVAYQLDLLSSRLASGNLDGMEQAAQGGELCGQGCEERLRLELSKKQTMVGKVLNYFR